MKTLNQSGQALITLIIFAAVSVIVMGATVMVSIINTQSTNLFDIGEDAYSAAETGAEDAILRLIRNPNYPGTDSDGGGPNPDQPIQITSSSSVSVTVSTTANPNQRVITARGSSGNLIRTVQITGVFDASGVFDITNWQEID